MARVEGRKNFALGAGAVIVPSLAGVLAGTFSGTVNRPGLPAPMAAAPIAAAEVGPAAGVNLLKRATERAQVARHAHGANRAEFQLR
ncbi:MAG TPA: hypothetical protein VF319_00675 [Caldimonas sp.]